MASVCSLGLFCFNLNLFYGLPTDAFVYFHFSVVFTIFGKIKIYIGCFRIQQESHWRKRPKIRNRKNAWRLLTMLMVRLWPTPHLTGCHSITYPIGSIDRISALVWPCKHSGTATEQHPLRCISSFLVTIRYLPLVHEVIQYGVN